jgi:hypothetical protein
MSETHLRPTAPETQLMPTVPAGSPCPRAESPPAQSTGLQPCVTTAPPPRPEGPPTQSTGLQPCVTTAPPPRPEGPPAIRHRPPLETPSGIGSRAKPQRHGAPEPLPKLRRAFMGAWPGGYCGRPFRPRRIPGRITGLKPCALCGRAFSPEEIHANSPDIEPCLPSGSNFEPRLPSNSGIMPVDSGLTRGVDFGCPSRSSNGLSA